MNIASARRRPIRSPGLPLAVLLGLVFAACGPSPTPSPSLSPSQPLTAPPDAGAIYRAIAAQVSTIRQLDAPDRVEPEVIDGPTLVANLANEFATSNPPAEIAKSERVLKTMGLLPADAGLAKIYLELQGSQVIGYYDPTVKKLFIVSRDGALGPIEELTYAHEFTHELQDKHFDLTSLGLDTIKDDSDRALALLGLVEGDAVSAQTAWMTANLTPAQLAQVAAEAADPAMVAVLARTPRILLETSLFPYQAGATFVAQLQAEGGYGSVNAAYKNLPTTTEQILHRNASPASLVPVRPEVPTNLASFFGAGWTATAQDTFGELQTRVWLREGGVAGDIARIAAEGWGGDRLALMDGPGGATAVAWITAWDSPSDAQAFESAANVAIAGLHLDAQIRRSDPRVAIVIRSSGGPGDAAVGGILRALLGPAFIIE